MTVRRPRPPRHRPLLTVPVPGHQVHVYVRTGRLSGSYAVDPGYAPTPQGGLCRAGDDTRAIGRRAAIRAAQHATRRHLDTDPPVRVPDGTTLPWGIGHDPSLRHHTRYFACALARHPHGTYVLSHPTLMFGDDWRQWSDYAYRSRRDAISGFQWARRYVPTGHIGKALRHDDTP